MNDKNSLLIDLLEGTAPEKFCKILSLLMDMVTV